MSGHDLEKNKQAQVHSTLADHLSSLYFKGGAFVLCIWCWTFLASSVKCSEVKLKFWKTKWRVCMDYCITSQIPKLSQTHYCDKFTFINF